jgi:hypothetical protein
MYRSMASQGGEGSAVAGVGKGNSTPIPQATPTSQAANPTSEAATPISQATSSRAGCKRKRTSAVWDEMEEKFENGEYKAYCNYCHKNMLFTCTCFFTLQITFHLHTNVGYFIRWLGFYTLCYISECS